MSKQKKELGIFIILLLFVAYLIIAARPIPRETVLVPHWLSSLETGVPVMLEGSASERARRLPQWLVPFTMGSRFGFVDQSGTFAVNNTRTGEIYLSGNLWTEYTAAPLNIEIKNVNSETVVNIEDPRGYPILLDNRIFILGSEQNSLAEIDRSSGDILWVYEFGAPLTCIDAAAGFLVAGSVDGIIEVLDSGGKRLYYFEPGGSRYSVILGCAISKDGSRIGIISGIDQQRFLMLERFGSAGDYRVVYHEFLDSDFRRDVFISFIDEDKRVVFESNRGIGCYSVRSRKTIKIPLDGSIKAIDTSGTAGMFFLITSTGDQQNELVGLRFPQDSWLAGFRASYNMRDSIFIRAPFKSDNVFLARSGSMLVAGGGTTLISFTLEEK